MIINYVISIKLAQLIWPGYLNVNVTDKDIQPDRRKT